MKRILSFALAAALAIGAVSPAYAETSTGTLDVNGGSLSLSNVPTTATFPAITVDGFDWKTSIVDIAGPVRVTDGRGTGEGWNLTVSATPLTEVGGIGLQLPAGSLVMYAPISVAPVGDTNAPAPVLATGYETVDANPFTIATAGLDTGLGTYDISFGTGAFEINVHPSAKVVDYVNYPSVPTPYETTVTWTLNNTP